MGLFRLFFISLFIVWTNVAFAGYECNSGADCARKGDIEPDQNIRFRYHQKACNVYNEPRACYSVSEYFINNDKQPEQVAKYIMKSCDLNYGKACFVLAVLLLDEERQGGPNYNAGVKFLEKACLLEEKEACDLYGSFLVEGKGLRQDLDKARVFFEKSCNLNCAQGCYNLAISYLELYRLESDTRNAKIAKEYFGKACDLGYQKGCDSYRKLNEHGY